MRCSKYIFIRDLAPDFNVLGQDKCKTKRETFKLWDRMLLVLEMWR